MTSRSAISSRLEAAFWVIGLVDRRYCHTLVVDLDWICGVFLTRLRGATATGWEGGVTLKRARCRRWCGWMSRVERPSVWQLVFTADGVGPIPAVTFVVRRAGRSVFPTDSREDFFTSISLPACMRGPSNKLTPSGSSSVVTIHFSMQKPLKREVALLMFHSWNDQFLRPAPWSYKSKCSQSSCCQVFWVWPRKFWRNFSFQVVAFSFSLSLSPSRTWEIALWRAFKPW